MIKLLWTISVIFSFVLPVSALEIEAPTVPESGSELMPRSIDSFGDALLELLEKAFTNLRPDLKEAAQIALSVFSAAMIVSILRSFSGNFKKQVNWAGAVAIAVILLKNSNSLIILAAATVQELSDYGKLLFPVMTAAMAAQGSVSSSAALYTGTVIFDSILCSMIADLFVPAVYFYLALAISYAATGEELLKRIRDVLKSCISWCLKTLLTVFTTYMSITGVVSGTADAAAIKATKVTISSVVPVVGSILSDASESVLVSAQMVKNTAGVYGILALLAVFAEPFLRIGIHYLLLKATAALCGIINPGGTAALTEDFSSAMGLLLAMTGAVCLLLMISTICFMKGVG